MQRGNSGVHDGLTTEAWNPKGKKKGEKKEPNKKQRREPAEGQVMAGADHLWMMDGRLIVDRVPLFQNSAPALGETWLSIDIVRVGRLLIGTDLQAFSMDHPPHSSNAVFPRSKMFDRDRT